MNRRESVLALLTLAVMPIGVGAQQPGRVWRIGVLENSSMALNEVNLGAFLKGMDELGYAEGKHFVIDYRSAGGRYDRFPELTAEMARGRVDLILTRGTPATLAAAKAPGAVPVVTTAISEPQMFGASLARPGGKVTGLVSLSIETAAKRVELVRELNPKVTKIGALFDMSNPATPSNWELVERSARSVGMQAQLFDVRRADDLERVIETAVKQRANALHVGQEAFLQAGARTIIGLAEKHRLLATYPSGEYVDQGGLLSYGVNYPDLYRRAASHVDRILKGAKPGDLPFERATKFDLVINLKTARALGIAISSTLLSRVDRVVE